MSKGFKLGRRGGFTTILFAMLVLAAPAYSSDWGPAEVTFPGSNGQIAFDVSGAVWVMNADGSGRTRLTFTSGQNGGPKWSPDGTSIAFFSTRDGNAEVYVMKADGSNQVNVSNSSADDFRPVWSAARNTHRL